MERISVNPARIFTINSSKRSQKLVFYGYVEIIEIKLGSGFSTTAVAQNYSHILISSDPVVLVFL